MRGGRWLLSATLSLALALPVAAQRPEVVDLRFRGNAAFSHSELASAIVTQESACRLPLLCWIGLGVEPATLDPSALEADAFRLKVYYYERGYREAQIASDTAMAGSDEVRVTFRIQEGRPVRVDSIALNGMPEALNGRRLPLRPGDPFDVVAYEATRDTLQGRLWNHGYARGQVLLGYTIRREAPYQATVQYDVYPGAETWFGAIDVEGTEEVSPELVHRMLTFDQGDRYSRQALLQSQRNLYGLQIFRAADVQADLEAMPDSLIPVTVRVAEGNMHRVRVGGGINSVECGNLEGQWTSRNFLGNGRRLTVRGRVGNIGINDCGWLVSDDFISDDPETYTGLASVDFTQPWFFGPRNSIGIGLFAEKRNIPEVFIRYAQGGYVSLSRSLGGNAALTLAYRPERTRLETENELVFCVNFVACTFDDDFVRELSATNWLAPLTLSFTMDRTDAVFTPSRGYIVRLDLEHAASYTGSEFAYTRFLAEGSQYFGEQGGVVLATRIRGGVGIPSDEGGLGLYPQKRFFAGGANSVRGTNQFRLGPSVLGIDAVPWLVNGSDPDTPAPDGAGCTMSQVNDGSCDASAVAQRQFELFPSGGEVLLEGNVELRFPLRLWNGRFRGAVFVDAGQVWATRDDVALGEVIATPGFGLRYLSPIGPIRVDAAFNTQGRTELTVLTTEVEPCALDQDGCRRVEDRLPRATLRNTNRVRDLVQPVAYRSDLSSINSFSDFLNRFQLHFSIGQAF